MNYHNNIRSIIDIFYIKKAHINLKSKKLLHLSMQKLYSFTFTIEDTEGICLSTKAVF